MKFSVCFDSKYKGMLKDVFKIKIKSMLNMIFFGLLFFVIGVYFSFWKMSHVITTRDSIIGYILMFIGVLFILFSPFGFLLKKYNKGFMDKINIDFYNNDNEWFYHLRGTKNNSSYEEEGKINLIEIKKGICTFSTLKGKDYFIPL